MTHGWILIQTEVGQSAAFLKMVVDHEILYPGIISPAQPGKYVWVWLVNEGNWAHRLGYYTVGFSHPGLLVGGFGPKPMVPTMPPFFRLGRAVFPD